jgi:hypothetical protein
MNDWYDLRKTKSIDANSPFASMFASLRDRWYREKTTEERLKVWDLYLESISEFIKPNLQIEDMHRYEHVLYCLSGTIFQALPNVPEQYFKEVGILGSLDQFYNNLRDLSEDTKRGISYFPIKLLDEFEININELNHMVSKPDVRFIRMIDYFLSSFATKMWIKVSPLLSSKSLAHSWRLLLDNALRRYKRIEYVFKLCNYNATEFSARYWNHVRAEMLPDHKHVSSIDGQWNNQLTSKVDDLWQTAEKVTLYEVEGFIAHDRHEYERAQENFYQSLRLMMPLFQDSVVHEIAKEKTAVLRYHDRIEESDLPREQKLRSPLWKEVLKHAESEAKLLHADHAYAFHKKEFYRLHGQGVEKFREHVYQMDRCFTTALTKDPELYLITAPIYLTCVAFHDLRRKQGNEEHDSHAVSMMKLNYSNYAANILHALNGKG